MLLVFIPFSTEHWRTSGNTTLLELTSENCSLKREQSKLFIIIMASGMFLPHQMFLYISKDNSFYSFVFGGLFEVLVMFVKMEDNRQMVSV